MKPLKFMHVMHFHKKSSTGVETSTSRNKHNKLRDLGIAQTAKENKEYYDNNNRFNVFVDDVAVEKKNKDEMQKWKSQHDKRKRDCNEGKRN